MSGESGRPRRSRGHRLWIWYEEAKLLKRHKRCVETLSVTAVIDSETPSTLNRRSTALSVGERERVLGGWFHLVASSPV